MTRSDVVRALFERAMERPPAEREAFVRREAGPDSSVAEQVLGLIGHAKSGALEATDHPTITPSGWAGGPSGGPPDRIGRYRILGVLGEGGFGVVYEAEQTEPVTRRVALKIIKPGMDSKGVVARFEAERQALAVMDHPCVAKVFDGGITAPEQGSRPYFVMELVRGEPITSFCDRDRLAVDGRLKLFRQVCDAVQHAHAKGVIHRDLKPSNILVSHTEKGPAPKVIDFGVAKAIHQQLTEQTVFTELGQMIGTPQYMSPEQASGVDIDTRSDVFSLGVVLYELLVGVTPIDLATLRQRGYAEIQRIIAEEDPPRPSTRLGSLASSSVETVEQIARSRRLELRSLNQQLRGELDWVIMKCLERDRSRRYATAAALGDELGRFLRGEAIGARPRSRVYVINKFVRRNRGLVAGAATVALVLVGATAVSARYAVVADRERRIAERERRISDEVVGYLKDDLFGTEDPGRTSATWTMRDAVLQAELDLRAKRQGGEPVDPEVEATLLQTFGESHLGLGNAEQARGPLEDAVGIWRSLADSDPGRWAPGLAVAELSLSEALVRLRLGDEATELSASALERIETIFGPTSTRFLEALNGHAGSLKWAGNVSLALTMYDRVLAGWIDRAGAESAEVGAVRYDRALTLERLSRNDEAVPEMRNALELLRTKAGERDPDTLGAMSELSRMLAIRGRGADGLAREEVFDESEELMRRAVELQREVLTIDHWRTRQTLASYGVLLGWRERWETAEPILDELHGLYRARKGPEAHDTLLILANLARSRAALGREIAAAVERGWDEAVAARATDDTLADFAIRIGRALRDGGEGETAEIWESRARVRLDSAWQRLAADSDDEARAAFAFRFARIFVRSAYPEHATEWGDRAHDAWTGSWESLRAVPSSDRAAELARDVAARFATLNRPELGSIWQGRAEQD